MSPLEMKDVVRSVALDAILAKLFGERRGQTASLAGAERDERELRDRAAGILAPIVRLFSGMLVASSGDEAKRGGVFEAFEGLLAGIRPDPTLLPGEVEIELKEHPEMRYKIQVPFATATAADLRVQIAALVAQTGDEVLGWSPQNLVVAPNGSICSDAAPLRSFGVSPGDRLQLTGVVRLRSKEPARCVRGSWKKGSAYTYYTCASCSLNWICESCAKDCHRGHEGVKVWIQGHTPSYAHCSCQKSDTGCKL